MNDAAEESYWRFDARRKGYGEWKETPQSERDAYKAEFAAALAAEREKVARLEARIVEQSEQSAKSAELWSSAMQALMAAEARERRLLELIERASPPARLARDMTADEYMRFEAAKAAMQGMMDSYCRMEIDDMTPERYAELSVRFANGLLAALKEADLNG